MKKYFLSIVALAGMLFATSCQESLVEPQMEGPTTFTVQLPDAMGTKAIGEASSVNKLFVEVYSNGNSIFKKSQEITNGSTTVSLDLIKGQEYQIVFWAQKDASYVTETDFKAQGLAEISIPTNLHNNESGAAFYAYEPFVIDGNAQSVTLRRPFAQLNLGTTEASLTTNAGDVELQASKVTFVTETATKFNTLLGKGTHPSQCEYSANISLFEGEKLTLANGDEYVYVSMDYLPVVGDKDVVELGVEITTNLGNITHSFTNVPIQKNYRTNIVGNLISSKTDFVVEVEDEWAGEENYNAEWGKLLYAAKNGGEVTLSANINLPEPIIVEGDMIVNLNDKTINAALFAESNGSINEGDTDSYAFWVKSGANLTINGKGNILTQPCKYSIAVWAEGGNVTINGGHYENQGEGSDLIYASAAGNIIINGGTFKACPKALGVSGTNETYSALNLKDNTGSHITVYGGSFYKFNPADNKSENPQVNFCAPGYGVSNVGDWYIVTESSTAYVSTPDQLNAALGKQEVNVIKLCNAQVFEGVFTITRSMTIQSEGENATLKGRVYVLNGANVTFQNVDFDTNDESTKRSPHGGNVFSVGYTSVVMPYAANDVRFESCNFKNLAEGRHAYSSNTNTGKAYFVGCSFSGTPYNVIYSYANVRVENCIYNINQSQVCGVNVTNFKNGKVEFLNNTYNGPATLTAAVLLLSTNNNPDGVFDGPVEFVVPTNDTWGYSIVKAGNWSFGSNNVITEGADKADL